MAVQSSPITKEDTQGELISRLEQLRGESSGVLHRIEVPLADVDPLAWLAAQQLECRAYWNDRNGSRELAAAGCAQRHGIDSPDRVPEVLERIEREAAQAPPGARLLGGLRFDIGRTPSPSWQAFQVGLFILPRFEVSSKGGETVLACHLRDFEVESVLAQVEQIRWKVEDSPLLPSVIDRIDSPGNREWRVLVEETRQSFERSRIEKLVLARRSELRLSGEVSPWHLLAALRQDSSGCYLYGMEPVEGSAFIGISPERLFYRRGADLQTEIFAGTRRRSSNPEEDGRLARNLLDSEKDRLEHRLAVDSVREELAELCSEEVAVTERQLVKLAAVQHLRTGFCGRLREKTRLQDLITALHPTPAVGGWPTEESIAQLREVEPFDRGWYAGPFGWVSAEESELIVAIRSAQILNSGMVLYSGAGIVEGSDSEEEWNELEAKITPFLELLNDRGDGST